MYRAEYRPNVGRHEDEPDVDMRLPMEGQELVADVHGTHVHETDPWGAAAIGVHDSGVQPCEEGCEGRRRRPMALRMRGGEQRWVRVDGFHGGGLAAASVAHVATTLVAPVPELRHRGPWRR